MNEQQFFAQCKTLAEDDSIGDWDSDSMVGFLQSFRDDVSVLRPLFTEIPKGLFAFDRLNEIFDATRNPNAASNDPYCVVRRPAVSDTNEMLADSQRLLTNYREMAIALKRQEMISALTPIPEIKVCLTEAPPIDPNDYDSLDVALYDLQSDWQLKLTPCTDHARWMRDAFYYLSCDSSLAYYVTWPWYADNSTLSDPYQPYFNLWRHGAVLRCSTKEDVVLYCPQAD